MQPRSDPVQARRGLHHFAVLLARKRSARLQPPKLPVQLQRKSRNLCRLPTVHTQRLRCRLQSRHRRRFQLLALRQSLLPILPKPFLAHAELSVLVQPRLALRRNPFHPGRSRLFWLVPRHPRNRLRQHIQVMHFAQQVLHPLQIFAPTLVQFRQQALHRVSKSLHTNSQLMPRLRLHGPQRLQMQLSRRRQSLQRQALRRQTIRRNNSRSVPQHPFVTLPRLRIKFSRRPQRRRSTPPSAPSLLTHSSSTCVSRKAPNCLKSLLPIFRIFGQAASGSTSSITAASDLHLRSATRKSCTASASGALRTSSSSSRTRSIQYASPRCSSREPGIMLPLAIFSLLSL